MIREPPAECKSNLIVEPPPELPGRLERAVTIYKARLVAKGYRQVQGVDFLTRSKAEVRPNHVSDCRIL